MASMMATVAGLVITVGLNTKVTQKNKTHGITNIAKTTNLFTIVAEVESKKPDVNNLAPGVVLSRHVIEMENKMPDTKSFISTPEFNRLTKIRFDSKTKQETKSFTINSHIDTSFNVFYVLMVEGSFVDNGSHNYFMTKSITNTFRIPTGDTGTIIALKSKGLSG